MGRPKATPELVAARRAQLIGGARRCFARRGFAGATVEDLERECGTTRGTLFKYFASKEELLFAVVEREEVERRAAFEEVARAVASGATLGAVLEQAARAQLRRSRSDPEALRLRLELLRLAEADPRLRRQVRRLEDGERRWRASLVRRLFRRGLANRAWSPREASGLVSAVFLGLAAGASYGVPFGVSDERLAGLVGSALARALAGPVNSPWPSASGARRGLPAERPREARPLGPSGAAGGRSRRCGKLRGRTAGRSRR